MYFVIYNVILSIWVIFQSHFDKITYTLQETIGFWVRTNLLQTNAWSVSLRSQSRVVGK